MKTRKLTALLLASTMLLSAAGCTIRRSEVQKEYIEALEDVDFVKHSSNNKDDIKDGAYTSTKSPEAIEEFFDECKFDTPDEYDVHCLTYALKRNKDKETKKVNYLTSFLIEFKDEDDAEDAFEDIIDFYYDMNDEYDTYYNVENAIDADDDYFYLFAQDGTTSISVAIVLVDENIYFIEAQGYGDEMEDYVDLVNDLCDSLGFDNPSDLL